MNDNDKKVPKRVAVYIRVSTEDQLDGYGPDTQKNAIKHLIEAREGTVEPLVFAGEEHVYFDQISGTVPVEERPEFSRLKEAIELAPDGNKPFDAIAVYRIDRFARKLKVLLDVISFFEENDIQFMSVTENIDTSNPFGRAIVSIIGVIAELEIETLKQRTQGGRLQAIKDGKHMGNAPVFGYIKDADGRLEILREEHGHVGTIFDLFVNQKYSVGDVARYLKTHEVLSPEVSAIANNKRKGEVRKSNSNFHWTHESVRRILREDLYTGNYYYGKTKKGKIVPKEKWELSPYVVPIIIDMPTFEKARVLLKQLKHNQRHTGTRPHPYLLSGLLKCDGCYDSERDNGIRHHWSGAPKKVKSTDKYTYYYSCGRKSTSKYERTCRVLPFSAEAIEKYVSHFCMELLKSPVSVFKHQQELQSSKVEIKLLHKKLSSINKLLKGLPSRRKNVLEQHEHKYIDRKELEERMADVLKSEQRYREEIEKIQIKVSENTLLDKYSKALGLFEGKYQKMLQDFKKHPEEVKEILHMLIDEIVVYSRPVVKDDKVSGPKKENQQIANRLHIKLKLPQDILNEIGKQEVLITEKAPAGADANSSSSSQELIAGGH